LYNIDDRNKPYRYVLPLLNIRIGVPSACIRISSKYQKQEELFGDIILALRLLRPLTIEISGAFHYQKEDHCANPSLYTLITMINIENFHGHNACDLCYTADDFKSVARLLKKFRGHKKKFKRLKLALNSFGQVTIGASRTYSMMYQELFACLGALFGSEHEADRLQTRVDNFFGRNDLGQWVGLNYQKKRNFIVHGNPLFWRSQKYDSSRVNLKRQIDLFNLHEIVRWSLLGFLGKTYGELERYNEKSLNKLQNEVLPNIKASKVFLQNQTMKLYN
jgi:hypothetical protein